MPWILPAILSPFFITVVNFTDKYILEKHVRDYKGMPVYGSLAGFAVGLTVFFLSGKVLVGLPDAAILILVGILTSWAGVIYFKAMSKEDASNIILLFQFIPALVLILSYAFLHEPLTIKQFSGFLVILLSAIFASENSGIGKFRISSVLILAFFFDLIYALMAILIKFLSVSYPFETILSYTSFGLGLGGLILFIFSPGIRNAFLKSFSSLKKGILALMFINEGTYQLGISLSSYALTLGSAALVSVVGNTRVFMGIFIGLFLTLFFPGLIKENISGRALTKKVLLSSVMFIGLFLVNS